jgi:hypothetical protein
MLGHAHHAVAEAGAEAGTATRAAAVRLRWVDGPDATAAEWKKIDDLLAVRGWMSLNRATTRVLVAEDDGELKGLLVFQMLPYLGPLFVVPSARGSSVPDIMLAEMRKFLAAVDARGWVVEAESPHTVALCERWGLQRMPSPFYAFPDPGGVGDG